MFSNPGNSATIGNVAALAAAIGAAVPVPPTAQAIATASNLTGARLVDTATQTPYVQEDLLSAPSSQLGPVDCRDSMSYSLTLYATGAPTIGAEIELLWFADAAGLVLIAEQTYEINTSNIGVRYTTIVDRSLGAFLFIRYGGRTGTGLGLLTVAVTLSVSSRPCDRPRVSEFDSGGAGWDTTDGLLGTWSGTLAAGVTLSRESAGLAVGKINFTIRCNGGGPLQMTWGWGWDRLQPINVTHASSPTDDVPVYELFAPNRPFAFDLKNTHATVSSLYVVNVWTTGD